jgi:hypothetical protein
VAPRSWFRVDVPRGGSAKHADPYWFAPDGFRFRSVKEIDRWREAGWDLGAMPRSALQGKKFDGLGISQEEALKGGVITPEQLERIRVSGGARAGGGTGPGKRRGGGDGSEDGEGARRRRRGDDSQAASAEGRSMQEQARAGLCMKTVSAIAPMQAQPVSARRRGSADREGRGARARARAPWRRSAQDCGRTMRAHAHGPERKSARSKSGADCARLLARPPAPISCRMPSHARRRSCPSTRRRRGSAT